MKWCVSLLGQISSHFTMSCYLLLPYFVLIYTDMRLRDFRIGTTNKDPERVSPSPDNYDTCASQDGAMRSSEYKIFDCTTRGRYVIIQLTKSEYLTLCEVEVFRDIGRAYVVGEKTSKQTRITNFEGKHEMAFIVLFKLFLQCFGGVLPIKK